MANVWRFAIQFDNGETELRLQTPTLLPHDLQTKQIAEN